MQNEIIIKLEAEERLLKQIIEKAQTRMATAPEGILRAVVRGCSRFYYQGTRDRGSAKEIRTYIPKDNLDLARQLAQKNYDRKILKLAQERVNVIEKFLKVYGREDPTDVYESLPSYQKEFVEADYPDDETYVRIWQSVQYSPGPFNEGDPEYYTIKGERVRSKTEKIIADTLYTAGIPYRYECPLKLKNGRILRPDFVILNVRTRKEYILEHLGMMDDQEYCSNALGKISTYIQNDIFPGDQLILTYESRTKPFSTKDLSKLIDHYFR